MKQPLSPYYPLLHTSLLHLGLMLYYPGLMTEISKHKHGKNERRGVAPQKPDHSRNERRRQLRLLRKFFLEPAIIGLRTEPIPSSSTWEEIEQRKKEVRYRIALLKALLAAAQDELKLLSQAKAADSNETTP